MACGFGGGELVDIKSGREMMCCLVGCEDCELRDLWLNHEYLVCPTIVGESRADRWLFSLFRLGRSLQEDDDML